MSRDSGFSYPHALLILIIVVIAVVYFKYWREDATVSKAQTFQNESGQCIDIFTRDRLPQWVQDNPEKKVVSLSHDGANTVVLSELVIHAKETPLEDDRSVKTLAANAADNATVYAYFSPKGGCTPTIVAEIAAAKQSLLVLAYSFTSDPVAAALVEAKKRGIDVQLVIDKGSLSDAGCDAQMLAASAPVFTDSKHKIQHQKVIIRDPGLPTAEVITGSFNFSKNAEEYNSENLLIIRSKKLTDIYKANWDTHRQHSDPMTQ